MAARNWMVTGFTVACLSVAGSAMAEPGHGLGHTVTDAQISSWNIDVAPDGMNLPQGSGTVKEGEQVYQMQCLSCHGSKLEGGLGPALAGGQGTLTSEKPLKTVGSYWPYATTLFDYIRRAMPFQQPQSLSNDQVYSVTGYILHMNQLLDAEANVDAQTLIDVKMPNRDAFYVDDRPDVSATACYQDCK